MKRTALKRKSPLRRKSPMRNKRTSTYAKRPRATPYMLWVKTLPCAVSTRGYGTPCFGRIQADHAGVRGMGQKSKDAECIALCEQHHLERSSFSGFFRDYDQAAMRAFVIHEIAWHQTLARDRGVEIPDG